MQPEQTELDSVLSDEDVVRYLTGNPEFFVNNQEVLSRLRIPHDSGKAVSLIEKQVSVLRGKCGTLENSLRDLIAVARENENLHLRLHGLIQDIISAATLEEIVSLTRNSLRENFTADDVHLLLVGEPARRAAASRKAASATGSTKTSRNAKAPTAGSHQVLKPVEGVRVISRRSASLKLFADLFDNRETVCGLPAGDQLDCFVGKEQGHIASAALIPLHHEKPLGVVMLTSRDESRFATGKGVMFLNQLGELLSRRLHTYGPIQAPAKGS